MLVLSVCVFWGCAATEQLVELWAFKVVENVTKDKEDDGQNPQLLHTPCHILYHRIILLNRIDVHLYVLTLSIFHALLWLNFDIIWCIFIFLVFIGGTWFDIMDVKLAMFFICYAPICDLVNVWLHRFFAGDYGLVRKYMIWTTELNTLIHVNDIKSIGVIAIHYRECRLFVLYINLTIGVIKTFLINQHKNRSRCALEFCVKRHRSSSCRSFLREYVISTFHRFFTCPCSKI